MSQGAEPQDLLPTHVCSARTINIPQAMALKYGVQSALLQSIIFGNLMDSHSLFLTGNTEPRRKFGLDHNESCSDSVLSHQDTVYVACILNLGQDGPTVIDVPGGAGPGTVNDAYFRFVCDMGKPGPDKGAGGKGTVKRIVSLTN